MMLKNYLRIYIIIIATLLFASQITISQINVDSLKKHIYFLASDSLEGRYSGTRTIELATNDIAHIYGLV